MIKVSTLLELSSELAEGGADVVASAVAHDHGETCAPEDLLKGVDYLLRRSIKFAGFRFVGRQEIDFATDAVQDGDESFDVLVEGNKGDLVALLISMK